MYRALNTNQIKALRVLSAQTTADGKTVIFHRRKKDADLKDLPHHKTFESLLVRELCGATTEGYHQNAAGAEALREVDAR